MFSPFSRLSIHFCPYSLDFSLYSACMLSVDGILHFNFLNSKHSDSVTQKNMWHNAQQWITHRMDALQDAHLMEHPLKQAIILLLLIVMIGLVTILVAYLILFACATVILLLLIPARICLALFEFVLFVFF